MNAIMNWLGFREVDEESRELRKLLKIEQANRRIDRKNAEAAERKLKKQIVEAKTVEEKATIEARKRNAKIALQHLKQAERYFALKEQPGLSLTRRSELNSIITARVEAVKGLGFKVVNISKGINLLERIANGG